MSSSSLIVYKIRNKKTGDWFVGASNPCCPSWTSAAFSAFYKSEATAKIALGKISRQRNYHCKRDDAYSRARVQEFNMFLYDAEIVPCFIEVLSSNVDR